MDIELKNQSVIEIGKAVGDNVNSLAGGASTALVPAGGGAVAPAGGIATPMNPFDSMMVVLSDIRDGIYSLVDKFSESVSIQQDARSDAAMAQDLSQVADAGEGASTEGTDPAPKQSFFQKAKDKVKGLMGMGGFKGLLIKGGLIFGLLGLAKLLQKYGGEIAKAVAPIIDGIKKFVSYITDDLATFGGDILGFVKDAFSGITNIIKGIFGGDGVDGELVKDGLSTLLALPYKFVGMVGKLVTGLLEAFLKVLGIDPAPEWVTKLYGFFDDLPLKAKEFFKGIMDFFTVTIPKKITEAKETVTQWFTDTVAGVKQFFVDVGNFFTVTIPTKLTEAYNNVTTFFTDIIGGIKGFFTDAFNYVTVEVPNKVTEVTKNIGEKFEEIRKDIIDFAMAPFKKIKELMKNLLVGILESVEGLPFIGDKAKALKEKILGTGGEAGGETLGTAGTGDAAIAEAAAMPEPKIMTNDMGDVVNPDTGKKVKFGRFDEEGAAQYAAELSKMGQGKFEPYFETKGVNHYAIRKTGEAVTGTGTTTTGGATGAEIGTESAMLAASGAGGGNGGVVMGGNNTQVSNNSVQHTSIDEKTGLGDNTLADNLAAD